MPAAATTRQVRAVALAVASFGLGVGGHLQAGGHATAPVAFALAAGFCALSGWSYSRRRLSAAGLVTVLLGNQVIIHLTLTLGAPMHSLRAASTGDCVSMSGMAGGPTPAAPVDTSAATMAMPLVPDRWMILAHLVATVLTAGVLLAVQTLCTGLAAVSRWLARVLRVALGTPLPFPATVRAGWAYLPTWTSRAVGCRPGRGPPTPALG